VTNGLTVLSKARKALAEAKTVCEVKAIRDKGHAAVKWAKQQRDIGFESIVDASADLPSGFVVAHRKGLLCE